MNTRPRIRTDNSFEFTVPAALERVAPLFGAWAERAWAGPDWSPRFLHPEPAHDEEGMVFQVAHAEGISTWVNTLLDLDAGRIQYVYVLPGVQAVVIDLRLSRLREDETAVVVRYRRTALDAAHDDPIEALGRGDAANGPKWAAALATCLRRAEPESR